MYAIGTILPQSVRATGIISALRAADNLTAFQDRDGFYLDKTNGPEKPRPTSRHRIFVRVTDLVFDFSGVGKVSFKTKIVKGDEDSAAETINKLRAWLEAVVKQCLAQRQAQQAAA